MVKVREKLYADFYYVDLTKINFYALSFIVLLLDSEM